jgi:hypothetical protein
MARGISRRALLEAPFALALLRAGGAAAQTPSPRLPVLPFNTSFSYWDHHWIQWLPDHPVYEAIEVALGEPGPDGAPLVRLWLTERAGAKHQIYYFNDSEVARTFAQESHFAPIEVEHRGAPGFAHDLSLRFTDKDGAPVRWELRFPAGSRLSPVGAGLKPQNGHAARSVLLFWYINPGAVTTDAVLTVGDARFAVQADRPAEHGYHAAYDSGAYGAVISYGASEVVPTAEGFTTSFGGGRAFRHAAHESLGSGIYGCELTAFRRRGRIVLAYSNGDSVESYRHAQGDHTFSIRFDSPLPAFAAGGAIGFHMLVDDHPVANGIVRPVGTAAMIMELHWEFADPLWAREAGLVTAIGPHENGGYAMRVYASS